MYEELPLKENISSIIITMFSSFKTFFSYSEFFLSRLNDFFPQTLPFPVYFILIYSLQFSLIFLTLSPPKSSYHYYIIYFILLIYFLLPLNYGYHFNCTAQGIVPVMVISYTWKMLIWLRDCENASAKKDKIVKPYYHSLFWWRKSSFVIINNQENRSNKMSQKVMEVASKDISKNTSISKYASKEEVSISKYASKEVVSKNISKDIFSNKGQNINIPVISPRYILTRLISFIEVTIIQEFWLIFVEYYMPEEISPTPYPIRVYKYFTSSDSNQQFFLTPFYAFYCVIYNGTIIWNMIWIYEIYLFVSSCLLYYIQSKKNLPNSIFSSSFIIPYPYDKLLIKLKISKNFSSLLEQWLYHFLFFTDPLFDSPHLSCSPTEFWSKRWHSLYRNCFVELGYLPCKKFINNSSLPHKKILSHIIGIFAGFLWSSIFHEYVMHSLFGLANGEHFTFFLFHGIIAIFWEIIVTLFRRNNNIAFDQKRYFYVKKVIGFVLWNSIAMLSAPWFAEPYIRAKHYYCYPHFGCDKGYKG
jgi:hypothetical protein